MSEPFLGEVRLFAFAKVPQGWLPCEGQVLNIKQYQGLAALLGQTYGGDGKTTFQLPDLRGRAPVGWGVLTFGQTASGDYVQGQALGAETVQLQVATIPNAAHTHGVGASTTFANTLAPSNNVLATPSTLAQPLYGPAASLVALNPGAVTPSGGAGAHQNMQPFLVNRYCIATAGIWPPRN